MDETHDVDHGAFGADGQAGADGERTGEELDQQRVDVEHLGQVHTVQKRHHLRHARAARRGRHVHHQRGRRHHHERAVCRTEGEAEEGSHRIDQSRARSGLRCGASGEGGRYTGPMRAWGKRRDGARAKINFDSVQARMPHGPWHGVCDPAERQLIRITNPPLQTDELRDEGATHAAIALRALQTVRSRAKGSHVGEEGET